MRSFAVVVLCAFTVGISAPACAEMEAKELLDLYQKSSVTVREEIESLVKKTETGFEWANADLTHNRKTIALYCSPEEATLTGPKLLEIMRRYVEQNPVVQNHPWGRTLLDALKELFPCARLSN